LTSFFPAKIAMDSLSGRSKAFGFVTFESIDDAEKAVTEMDGMVGPRFHFSFSFF
jgi:RNA recognition motif-containing protein